MLTENFLIHFVRLPTLGLLHHAPEAFYTAWRKCLRRIDGLPNKTHKIILPVLWETIAIY